MKVSKRITALLSAALILLTVLPTSAAAAKKPKSSDDGMNMFDKSDFIEKEQPELTEETKQLISLYKRKPTEETISICVPRSSRTMMPFSSVRKRNWRS